MTRPIPKVGDVVEFKIGRAWKRGSVRHVYGDGTVNVHAYGCRKRWRWPAEAQPS